MGTAMPADRESQPRSEPDGLEAATDQAIAACGGDARDAVKALIVANEFLEAQVEELRADVSRDMHAATTTEGLRPTPANRREDHGRGHLLRCIAIRRHR